MWYLLQAKRGSLGLAVKCQSLTTEAGMAVTHGNANEESKANSRAIVIGGGLAGLASARVLSDLFDEVILLERDGITQQASLNLVASPCGGFLALYSASALLMEFCT